MRLAPQRWRMLLAVAAGLVMLLITGWPVAALAAAAAVIFLPRLSFVRGQRRRTEMLEGLEQWIRRLSDMLTASRGLEEALEASARTAPAAIAEPVTTLAAGCRPAPAPRPRCARSPPTSPTRRRTGSRPR